MAVLTIDGATNPTVDRHAWPDREGSSLHRALNASASRLSDVVFDCRMLPLNGASVAPAGVVLLNESRDVLCQDAELVWIHYAGTADVEPRAGLRPGEPVSQQIVLAPDDSRPPELTSLLDFGSLSQADEVVFSFDLQTAVSGILDLLRSTAAEHLGPRCGLIAVASRRGPRTFTGRAAGMLGRHPEVIDRGSLAGALAGLAGAEGLVLTSSRR